jgi:hypothetical protein
MKRIGIGGRVPTHDGHGVITDFKHSNGIDFAVVEMDDPKRAYAHFCRAYQDSSAR